MKRRKEASAMSKKSQDKDYLKTKSGGNVDLGRLVAEHDPSLQDYYVEPEKYVARASDFDDPAVFFLGPKGVGKSAVLQMIRLTKSADINRIIDISPDDLAFSALANVEASTPLLKERGNSQWLFKSLWDYILSLEVLRREYRDRSGFLSCLTGLFSYLFGKHHEAEARRLLSLSVGDDGTPQTLSTRILQLIKEVELSADLPGASVGGKVTIDSSRVGEGKQLGLLSLINSVAKRIGEILKHPYYILIDDLDLHWQDAPVQNAFIAALFLSLRKFSKPPNLKCVVAIREQIFRRLPLTDRDKYHDW